MTFSEYIIKERGSVFYHKSLSDIQKHGYGCTLEEWFRNMYYDWELTEKIMKPKPPPTEILKEGEVPFYEKQLKSVYVSGIDTNNEIEKIVIEMRKTHKELMIEKFETEYPSLAVAFKALQEDQYQMFASKMSDYGLGNISLGTKLETQEEKKMSLSGIFFRVNDKINRWKNMLIKGGEAQNEPLTDSWKDISVYCLIAQLVNGDNWKK